MAFDQHNMLSIGFGISTPENAKCLKGKKALSAPMQVHWGSDTTLEQVPGISTSDTSSISLCHRSLEAIFKTNFTEVNR